MTANQISVLGMLAGIGAGFALAATAVFPDWQAVCWILGGVLIFSRLLANMFDGMVAIESKTVSPVGDLYNEFPDRVSDVATIVGLGFAINSHPLLGFVAAIAALFTAYARSLAKSAGAPQDYRGPMAKQQRMFLVIGLSLFQALTPTVWHGTLTLANTTYEIAPLAVLAIIIVGCVLTTLRRLWGAAAYLKRA
jgi:phosphatidylglycerophosphate synthase